MLARTIFAKACKVVNAVPKRSFGSLVTRATRSENTTSQKLTGASNNIFSARPSLLLNKTKSPFDNRIQIRRLNVHEYQAQNLMRSFGIKVPRGGVASTPEEAAKIAAEIGGDVIVKAQVLAGGRGKGKFTSGLRGGVHICTSPEDVAEITKQMLGYRLITKQTGEQGRPVSHVYICERKYNRKETYLAITMDRSFYGPVLVASSAGGVDIEGVAAETPDLIVKEGIDIFKGLQREQAERVAQAVGFKKNYAEVAEQIMKIYDLFIKKDATLVEINPFVETSTGEVLCLDAKINFDDNALFRQKDVHDMRDPSQEDPREVAASQFDLNYIGLDGNIACLVNGAGLAMATMDIIKLHGGRPANFLDVGGGASERQVAEAFKILVGDPNVKAILVNIFGGIMRCDVIALGIINAAKELSMRVPVIVRLQGTNVGKAKEIMEKSGLRLIPVDDLDQAAAHAVSIAQISQIAEDAQLKVHFELPL